MYNLFLTSCLADSNAHTRPLEKGKDKHTLKIKVGEMTWTLINREIRIEANDPTHIPYSRLVLDDLVRTITYKDRNRYWVDFCLLELYSMIRFEFHKSGIWFWITWTAIEKKKLFASYTTRVNPALTLHWMESPQRLTTLRSCYYCPFICPSNDETKVYTDSNDISSWSPRGISVTNATSPSMKRWLRRMQTKFLEGFIEESPKVCWRCWISLHPILRGKKREKWRQRKLNVPVNPHMRKRKTECNKMR